MCRRWWGEGVGWGGRASRTGWGYFQSLGVPMQGSSSRSGDASRRGFSGDLPRGGARRWAQRAPTGETRNQGTQMQAEGIVRWCTAARCARIGRVRAVTLMGSMRILLHDIYGPIVLTRVCHLAPVSQFKRSRSIGMGDNWWVNMALLLNTMGGDEHLPPREVNKTDLCSVIA